MKQIKPGDVTALDVKGFNIIADFIFAKRENRIIKLGKIADYSSFRLFNFFKATNNHDDNPNKLWFIKDGNFKEVKRTTKLTAEERKYPLIVCFSEESLIKKINNKWLPEQDEIGL